LDVAFNVFLFFIELPMTKTKYFADPERIAALEPENVKLRKKVLKLITSLVSNKQARMLRASFAKGVEDIADLARRTNCPPVLLYVILTPLWSKTAMKLRLLGIEKKVIKLRDRGYSDAQIAKELQLPVKEISEHSDKRWSPETYESRHWYTDRAPKPSDPDELVYDEATLPPLHRIDVEHQNLYDIPHHLKGRCPNCGHLVSIPCLACRVRKDTAQKKRKKVYVEVGEWRRN